MAYRDFKIAKAAIIFYAQFVIDVRLCKRCSIWKHCEFESLITCIWKNNTRQTSFQNMRSIYEPLVQQQTTFNNMHLLQTHFITTVEHPSVRWCAFLHRIRQSCIYKSCLIKAFQSSVYSATAIGISWNDAHYCTSAAGHIYRVCMRAPSGVQMGQYLLPISRTPLTSCA